MPPKRPVTAGILPAIEGTDRIVNHERLGNLRLKSVGAKRLMLQGNTTDCLVWKGGGLTVLVSQDLTHHGPLLHMSISHKHRYPTWDEIAAVRYGIIPPHIDMMMMLPQASDYVAFHPNCFHLWQTPGEWGVQ